MKKKINFKLIGAFAIALFFYCLCIKYAMAYQDVSRELSVAQYELSIANNNMLDMADSNEALKAELASANATIEGLKENDNELIYLGDYKLTAYCACEICCEEFALNRPKDVNGNPIVYTASGTVAQQGRTIGVNPEIIPYGTEVYIEGQGWFVAEDTGVIQGQHIDIYMGSHEAALSSGLSHGNVWMLINKS